MKSLKQILTEQQDVKFGILVESDNNKFNDMNILNWDGFDKEPSGHIMNLFKSFVNTVKQEEGFSQIESFIKKNTDKSVKLDDPFTQMYTQGTTGIVYGPLSIKDFSELVSRYNDQLE